MANEKATKNEISNKATKNEMLQDQFLNAMRKDGMSVAIYLVNGIKLQGTIDGFDQFVILLKSGVNQMVYKHAISTVVPASMIRVSSSS